VQEIVKGKFGTWQVPIRRLEGMEMPSDEGIVGSIDSLPTLDQGKGTILILGVEVDINESLYTQEDSNLNGDAVQDANIVSGDQVRPIAGQADGFHKL
jgi:hypothetical protein